MKEADLYRPLRDYLLAQAYTVQGEVRDCDLVAQRGEDLIVVEFKRGFTVDLLVQACDRLRITAAVYVALPGPWESGPRHHWQGREQVLRRLELGLIIVHLDCEPARVEIRFHPVPYQRQQRDRRRCAVLQELHARSGDHNTGGSPRHRLVTAWRENSIFIACCLDHFGPLTPRLLRSLGTGPKTLGILNSRLNREWFERIGPGLYRLKASGRAKLAAYPELVAGLRRRLAGSTAPAAPP